MAMDMIVIMSGMIAIIILTTNIHITINKNFIEI